jgi:transcriptional regulator with XRE-family HTH domain
MTFSEFVRRERLRRGLTRERLAERARLDTTFLEKVETNRATPTLRQVRNLAEGLDLSEVLLLEQAGYLTHIHVHRGGYRAAASAEFTGSACTTPAE